MLKALMRGLNGKPLRQESAEERQKRRERNAGKMWLSPHIPGLIMPACPGKWVPAQKEKQYGTSESLQPDSPKLVIKLLPKARPMLSPLNPGGKEKEDETNANLLPDSPELVIKPRPKARSMRSSLNPGTKEKNNSKELDSPKLVIELLPKAIARSRSPYTHGIGMG